LTHCMISRHKISSSPTSVFLGKPENIGVLWNLVPTGIAIAPPLLLSNQQPATASKLI
jgi:hypothetical protein